MYKNLSNKRWTKVLARCVLYIQKVPWKGVKRDFWQNQTYRGINLNQRTLKNYRDNSKYILTEFKKVKVYQRSKISNKLNDSNPKSLRHTFLCSILNRNLFNESKYLIYYVMNRTNKRNIDEI